MRRINLSRLAGPAGWILALALLINAGLPGAHSKPPQQRTNVPAFRSGAQRSEEVLRDILTVLNRIDGRLERLEKRANSTRPSNSRG